MRVEVLDPDTGSFREIALRGQREPVVVEYGIAAEVLAPKTTVRTTVTEDINAAQRLRVLDDADDVIFEGDTRSSGTRNSDGSRVVEARHDAYAVFADSVSVSVSSPTDQDVLQAALNAADGGSAFTLTYAASPVALGQDYEVEDRSVKRIFEDMADRAGRVYYVGVGDTITVNDSGGGGLWQSIEPGVDQAQVRKYDEGDVESVINAVTVNGTGAEKVEATASDSGSITTYGRRTGESPYNISYITDATEAQSMADALLQPQPQSTAEIITTASVGDITVPHINEQIDLTDPNGTRADETLTIVGQTIQPGQTTFTLGAGGETFGTARFNRSEKSKGDVTEPGSVYDSDRISDGAISEQKIVDLSITETKITDDAISTPKLQAEAVEASKILANTITAGEIAANTLTAEQIDALDIDTDTLTIGDVGDVKLEFLPITGGETALVPESDETCQLGTFGREFATVITTSINVNDGIFGSGDTIRLETIGGSESTFAPEIDGTCQLGYSGKNYSSVWAQQFIDEGTVVAGDGGDPLAGLAEAVEPPEQCRVRDDDGNTEGIAVNSLARELWKICTAQQRRIDDLEARLSKLEAQQ